jgi:hypothetical protein
MMRNKFTFCKYIKALEKAMLQLILSYKLKKLKISFPPVNLNLLAPNFLCPSHCLVTEEEDEDGEGEGEAEDGDDDDDA